jgi:hypothetical protein
MADHGDVQYSTADGNDYPAHEAAYANFVHTAFVGTLYCINTVLGLTIVGVVGQWLVGVLVIFLVAPIALVHGLATGSRASTLIALAISLLAFFFTATG